MQVSAVFNGVLFITELLWIFFEFSKNPDDLAVYGYKYPYTVIIDHILTDVK